MKENNLEEFIRKEPIHIDIVASANQPVKNQKKSQEAESSQAENGTEANNEPEIFAETKITKLDVDDFPDLTKEPICILLLFILIT